MSCHSTTSLFGPGHLLTALSALVAYRVMLTVNFSPPPSVCAAATV